MDTFKIRKVEVSGDRFTGTNLNDITLSVPSDNNGKSIHIGLSNSSNFVSIKPNYTVINNNLQVIGDIVTRNNALIAELPITTSDIANGAINADKLKSKTGLSDTVVLSQSPMLYTPSIRGEMIFSPLSLAENNVEILTQVDAKNVLPGKYADGVYEFTNLNISDELILTRKTAGTLLEAPVDGLVNDRYGISYDSTGSMNIYSSKKNSSSKINIGFASGSVTYDSPLVINQQYITANTLQDNYNSFYCLRVQNGGILIDTNNSKGDMDYLNRSYEMKNRNSFQIRNNDLVANVGTYNPLSESVHKVRMKIGKSSDDYASIIYTMGDGESNSHAVFSLNGNDALILSKGKSSITSSTFEVNNLLVNGDVNITSANIAMNMKASQFAGGYQYSVRPFLQYGLDNKPLIEITEGRSAECNDISINTHIYDDAEWSLFHNGSYFLTAISDWSTHKKTFSVFSDFVELDSVVGISKTLEVGNDLAGKNDSMHTALFIHHQHAQAPTVSSTANDYALMVSRMGGTASLGFASQVGNQSKTDRVPGASIMFEANDYATGSAGKLMFNISSNVSSFTDSQITAMTIDKNANIGIGITQPSEKLHVNGKLHVNSTISIDSDDRIKTNEVLITNATETINKLRPQIYDKWNTINHSSNSNAQYIKESGLIAQEIFSDAPELHHLIRLPFDSSSASAVNYIGLIPYLVKALQEKDEELLYTKNRLLVAESNISSLDARLSAAGY